MQEWHGSLVCEAQEEKFQFGSREKVVPHGSCHVQGTQECGTRVAIKALTVWGTYITNYTSDHIRIVKLGGRRSESGGCCRLQAHFAWHDGKGIQVREEVHISFSYTRKALYCRSVKPFAMNETIRKLFDRYGHTFCHTDDIGKFEIDEAHTLGFNGCQDLFTPGLILLLR